MNNVLLTLTEMLKDRGLSFNERALKENKKYEIFKDDILVALLFYFSNINIKTLRTCIEEMIANKCKHVILLVGDRGCTPATRSAIGHANVSGMNVELFTCEELTINVTHHRLVPLHEKLNNQDRDTLLKRHSFKPDSFPRLLSTDPIYRYYGYSPGDIIRITRKCGEIVYRLCEVPQ